MDRWRSGCLRWFRGGARDPPPPSPHLQSGPLIDQTKFARLLEVQRLLLSRNFPYPDRSFLTIRYVLSKTSGALSSFLRLTLSA